MLQAFLHGLILAAGLILPLGAQNVFIFNQGALQPRFYRVLPVVLVAGLCDTTLILAAVLGVSAVVLTLAWFKLILVAIGVVFLGYVGWVTWHSDVQPTTEDGEDSEEQAINYSLRRQILFTLSVSWLNPHAILDTIGVIGTSSLSYAGQQRVAFTLACILVSWMWFFILALTGRILGSADKSGVFRKLLNRVSAVIMWISAVYLIYNLIF